MRNKDKVLFLWLNDKEFHSINARRRGVKTSNVYKNLPVFLKAIRRIQIMLDIFSIYPWLGDWRNNLNDFDTVIIHASRITSPVVRYIHNNNPKIRIIVWYWNPVLKCEKLEKYPSEICERWTFDEQDAENFNLKYNRQYYFNDILLEDREIVNDVFFIGGDKGRLGILKNLEKELQNYNIRTDFHITKTSKNSDKNAIYKKRISYDESLKKVSSSKAILDIVSAGQTGLTLRPLEALFFQKKLITNDKSILNRDFYNPNNIFVLEHNNMADIKAFLESPYSVVPQEIMDKYDFDKWLNRFFNK